MPNDGPPHVLVIGHITHDVSTVPNRGYSYGGTATFGSVGAHRMGYATGLVTATNDDPLTIEALAGVAIHAVTAAETTTFENVYTAAGRVQYVRAVAPALAPEDIPATWRHAPVVLLGSVAGEIPRAILESLPTQSTVGATLQGWLRTWDEATGRVRPIEWREADAFLDRLDVVVFSPEDVGNDTGQVRRYASRAHLAVVTENRAGCTVWHHGRRTSYPAFEANEVEPTGAGDVFAVAFITMYRETNDIDEAARFANCTASFVVEGSGVSAIPTRAQVDERLRTGRYRQ